MFSPRKAAVAAAASAALLCGVGIGIAGTNSPDNAGPDATVATAPPVDAAAVQPVVAPVSPDDTTAVQMQTTDGQPAVIGATDADLAAGDYVCGGDGEAEYNGNPEAFNGNRMLSTWDSRPELKENLEAFWRGQLGNETFDWLLANGAVNGNMPDFVPDSTMDQFAMRQHAVPGGFVSTEARANFTCKGDEVTRHGILTFRADGKFSNSYGFVVNHAAVVAMLQEQGMTLNDLPVHWASLGDGTMVFIEMGAVGCLNPLLKLPPESPPQVVPPTTAPPTTAPATTQPTTTMPGTTMPTTTSTLPQTTTTVQTTTSTTLPATTTTEVKVPPSSTLPPPATTIAIPSTVITSPPTAPPDSTPTDITVIDNLPPDNPDSNTGTTQAPTTTSPPNTQVSNDPDAQGTVVSD